jgi:hypothetical protein
VPWRGPETPGEFPTLGDLVGEWIEASCAIPDRHAAGEPFVLTDEQWRWLQWFYRLHPDATPDPERPSAPFTYNGGVMVRPQKWGKGPLSAAMICAEAAGPVLFDGWDAHGEPVGRPWPTPHIQATAVSEDQTDNVWRALVPMIELGDIAADIPDTGLTRINLPNGGIIEPVTASARSRLGQRITFVVQDETHSWVKRNGGHRLADTQRRNLAGTGGRWAATTNAYDPSERSVAQLDVEASLPDVLVDYPTPVTGSWKNKRERRKILRHAYAGAPWVDLDRIEADCDRLAAKGDPGQAERFFGNRVVAAADAAFDVLRWGDLAQPGATIDAGRTVTLGFDGARRRDSTGIVATDVETGLQIVVAVWERSEALEPDEDWEIDGADVREAMASAFDRWNVWRLYADPPYWETHLDEWESKYVDDAGKPRVVKWWTNRRRPMAFALQAFNHAIIDGSLTHDGDERLARHIGNARKVSQTGILDADGRPLWLIEKDRPDSPRKIDLAMAACLSWEARGDAIAAGALNPPKRRSRQLITF